MVIAQQRRDGSGGWNGVHEGTEPSVECRKFGDASLHQRRTFAPHARGVEWLGRNCRYDYDILRFRRGKEIDLGEDFFHRAI